MKLMLTRWSCGGTLKNPLAKIAWQLVFADKAVAADTLHIYVTETYIISTKQKRRLNNVEQWWINTDKEKPK
jgi:hypothetical protein